MQRILRIFLLGWIAAAAGTTAAEPLPDGAALAVGAGGAVFAVDRQGGVRELAAVPGLRPGSLRRTADGWWATGAERREEGWELILLRGGASGVERVEPPPGGPRALRGFAVPLVEQGRLAGLAWLEGEHHRGLSVVAAVRDGAGWGPVETVSPPGPGTQTALAGAVLEDGSWLLSWSAFDGEDDEILWSRRSGGRWSAPRRLHAANGVPDIVPAVTASGGGALAAWSRFDGNDYRLVVSRFEDGAWAETEDRFPKASLEPSFLAAAEGAYLLYHQGVPSTWWLVELDARGRAIAAAAAADPSPERPIVVLDAGVRFVWPGLGPVGATRERSAGWEVVP